MDFCVTMNFIQEVKFIIFFFQKLSNLNEFISLFLICEPFLVAEPLKLASSTIIPMVQVFA